jgi:hypothetical protein
MMFDMIDDPTYSILQPQNVMYATFLEVISDC